MESMTFFDMVLVYVLHAGTAAAITMGIMFVAAVVRLVARLVGMAAEAAPRCVRILTGRRRVLSASGEILPGGGCVMETLSGRWVCCDEEGRRWK